MEFIAFGNCGPYPKADEACSSYLVTHHDRGILFDIGTGSLARLLKVMDPCTFKVQTTLNYQTHQKNFVLPPHQ